MGTTTNVKFLKGKQSSLNAIIAQNQPVVEGAFYLTEDTNRLYYGQNKNSLALLNKTIAWYKTVQELPDYTKIDLYGQEAAQSHKEDFAYISNSNILCTWTGTSWVQINPDTDTNTDTKVSNIKWTSEAKQIDGIKKLVFTGTITNTVTDVKNGGNTGTETVTTTFTIDPSQIAEVFDIQVGQTSEYVQGSNGLGSVSLSNAGVGAKSSDKVTFSGSKSVSITKTADQTYNIQGTDTKYQISTDNNAAIHVKTKEDTNSGSIAGLDDSKVTFSAGQDLSVSSSNSTGTITYAHTKHIGNVNTDNYNMADKATREFSAITKVTLSNGHIDDYTTTAFTLPPDKDTTYTIDNVTAGDNGDLTVSLKDNSGGDAVPTTGSGLLYYKYGNTKIFNHSDLQPLIKKELNAVNAMVYKGTVSSASLPVSASIGDTYMADTPFTYGKDIHVGIGDLFIATGASEGSDGLIQGEITWTYIPSANDTDTTYELNANGNILKLTNKVDDSHSTSVKVAGDSSWIDLTASAASGLKATHKTKDFLPTTKTASLTAGKTFTTINGLQLEKNHIIGYNTTTYTLPDDKNTTYTLPVATIASGAQFTLTDSDAGEVGIVKIAAPINNDLLISSDKSNNTISINHKEYGAVTNPNIIGGEISNRSLKVISGLELSNGHVTNIKTATYTLPVDKNTTYNLNNSTMVLSGGNKIATFTTNLKDSNQQESKFIFSLNSQSLTFSKGLGNNALDLNLTWETF